jgi:Uma2 family endonuclease
MQSTAFNKLQSPPRTAIEVFEMLPEGTLAEVINNVLYMAPSPTFNHQDLLSNLHTDMNLFIRQNNLGKCVVAPIDVYLGNDNAVQPDIIFIATENLKIIQEEKVKGVPDLIVEILSGNKKHDMQRKKSLYEEFGVKEYFIIHQVTKEVITYYYDGGKFTLQESKKGKLKSKLLKKTFAF